RGDSVSLRLLDSPDLAAASNRAGVRRLFVLVLGDELASQVDYSSSPGMQRWMDEFSPRVGEEDLRRDLIDLIADRAFIGDHLDIRTAEKFDERLNLGWGNLWNVANDIGELVGRLAEAYQLVREHMGKMESNTRWQAALRDVEFQLEHLLPAY